MVLALAILLLALAFAAAFSALWFPLLIWPAVVVSSTSIFAAFVLLLRDSRRETVEQRTRRQARWLIERYRPKDSQLGGRQFATYASIGKANELRDAPFVGGFPPRVSWRATPTPPQFAGRRDLRRARAKARRSDTDRGYLTPDTAAIRRFQAFVGPEP